MRNKRGKRYWIWLCLFFSIFAQAQEISVRAVVENDEVFVGEPFVFQIQIEGHDTPPTPDISALQFFQAEFAGGQKNNSESVTIVNGRVSRVVRRGYFFSYRLTATRPGRQTIPSFSLQLDGKTFSTKPLVMQVKAPQETDDYKLRCSLSSERCYVGQPVILSVTWYIGKKTRNFHFTLPVVQDDRFFHESLEGERDPGKEYYRLEMSGRKIIAEKGSGMLDGKNYLTIFFQTVMVPKSPGLFDIPPATVVCEGLSGHRRNERDDFFNRFFNDDLFGDPGNYKRFVVPSNSLRLNVSPLPEEGRPADFAGHIGHYRLEASAKPTEVNVGDPITLTLALEGSEYLKHVGPPNLNRQSFLIRDFKLPQEIASGEIRGKTKVFTQTLRATHEKVTEIPALELPFFDPTTGKYAVARSNPIPLTVRATKVVTAKDAEGVDLGPEKSEVKGFSEGIAHNYEDMGVLEDQEYGLMTLRRIGWALAIFLPFGAYVAIFGVTFLARRAQADPLSKEARKAGSVFFRRAKEMLKTAPSFHADLLSALRRYLGSKLRARGEALTYLDVERSLSRHGLESDLLNELRNIFEECEAGCYAGAGKESDVADLLSRACETVKQLERKLP